MWERRPSTLNRFIDDLQVGLAQIHTALDNSYFVGKSDSGSRRKAPEPHPFRLFQTQGSA